MSFHHFSLSNFSAISWREQVTVGWDNDSVLDQINTLRGIFMVLAHWNNSLWVDMSLHSDTEFYFKANQSLFLLLYAVWLTEKPSISIWLSLVWPGRGLNQQLDLHKKYLKISCKKWFDLVWFMVFYATFNNILAVSWQSVLLVEETGVPGENQRPVASNWRTLSHHVVLSTSYHVQDSNSQL